jgi:hypothetical protein
MIDAAIFGKPVCTVELPALAPCQRGTVHFEYLTTAGGGLLRTATSFDEHVRTLGDLVRRDPYARDELGDRSVRAFVRPRGIDVPANEIFVQEMLMLLESSVEARVPGAVSQDGGPSRPAGGPCARCALRVRAPDAALQADGLAVQSRSCEGDPAPRSGCVAWHPRPSGATPPPARPEEHPVSRS